MVGAICPHCGHFPIQGYDKSPCWCPICENDITTDELVFTSHYSGQDQYLQEYKNLQNEYIQECINLQKEVQRLRDYIRQEREKGLQVLVNTTSFLAGFGWTTEQKDTLEHEWNTETLTILFGDSSLDKPEPKDIL